MGLLGVILITAIVTIVGGGIAYLIYLKTKPKRMTWIADIYQRGQGTLQRADKDKKKIGIVLNELKYYGTDVLRREETKPGVTNYILVKMKKTTPAPDADCVENRESGKRVIVLYDGDTCTLLKKGYDEETSSMIFTPMPYDDMTMIKNELIQRQERFKPAKDIITAITPWVVAGIMALALVGGMYLYGEGIIKSSKNFENGQIQLADAVEKQGEMTREGMIALAGEIQQVKKEQLGKQDTPKAPMIE